MIGVEEVRREVHGGEATVVCPLGQPPDNDFDRASAAPPELLWEVVERSLNGTAAREVA